MAPIIATLLTQGLSLVANAAMAKGEDWLEKKTGVDLSKAALSETDLLKLKQYEMEHEEELLRLQQEDDKLSLERERLYISDVASSRAMQEAALKQNDLFSKRFIYWFSIFWSVFGAVFILSVTFLEIPADNVRFADTIIGFLLGTILSQMFGWYFGSSQGSKDKTALLLGGRK